MHIHLGHVTKIKNVFNILSRIIVPNRLAEHLFFNGLCFQGQNQETFRARKVSWNKGTLINSSTATDEGKAPQNKISDIFFLDTFKAAF